MLRLRALLGRLPRGWRPVACAFLTGAATGAGGCFLGTRRRRPGVDLAQLGDALRGLLSQCSGGALYIECRRRGMQPPEQSYPADRSSIDLAVGKRSYRRSNVETIAGFFAFED